MTAQLLEQPYQARRQNWTNQLVRHALMQPDATALRVLGHTTTWAELHRRASALAGALRRRGVGVGDRLLILMLNRTEFIESLLAATALGAIAVPVNFRLTGEEPAFLIEDCEARIAITETVLAGVAAEVRDLAPLLETVVVAGSPSGDGLVGYEDLIDEEGAPAVVADVPDEKWGEVPVAVVALTATATSHPKLEDLDVFLSQRLARYKRPKALEIVDALPRNPAGKVLTTELRALFGTAVKIDARESSSPPTVSKHPAGR